MPVAEPARGRGSAHWQPPSSRGAAPWAGRGRGRGRGALPVAHHHRTLVINNTNSSSRSSSDSNSNNKTTANNTIATNATATTTAATITTVGNSAAHAANGPGSGALAAHVVLQDSGESGVATTSSGWVAKRDRHFQLINSSIYDKEVQARTKAIAKTREEKLLRKEAREKQKFNRYLQDSHGLSTHEIEVGGERFRVTAGGSKLVRLSGEQRAIRLFPTPECF